MLPSKPFITKAINHSAIIGSRIFRSLPISAQQTLSQPIIDRLITRIFSAEELSFMDNKVLKLQITDWKHEQFFSKIGDKVQIISDCETPNITFCGDMESFLSLMTHSQDPDTLFFQRRLKIIGDTELGLEIKALFDNLELENLPTPLAFVIRQLHQQYRTESVQPSVVH